jgi:hypothetical protein
VPSRRSPAAGSGRLALDHMTTDDTVTGLYN